jgi:hypothetical protein
VARKLRALGVKGTLIKAAELGYITELTCGMPECFCPKEFGGRSHFVARTQTWNYWEPTLEHFPIPKRDGGRKSVDNAILAHRLCNKLDYFISQGLSMEKDLARVEAARKAAAAANLPEEPPASAHRRGGRLVYVRLIHPRTVHELDCPKLDLTLTKRNPMHYAAFPISDVPVNYPRCKICTPGVR